MDGSYDAIHSRHIWKQRPWRLVFPFLFSFLFLFLFLPPSPLFYVNMFFSEEFLKKMGRLQTLKTTRKRSKSLGSTSEFHREVILLCLVFPVSAFSSHLFFVGPLQMVQPRVGNVFFSYPLSGHSSLPFFPLRFFFTPSLLSKVPLLLPSPFWSPFTPPLHPEVHKSTHHN